MNRNQAISVSFRVGNTAPVQYHFVLEEATSGHLPALLYNQRSYRRYEVTWVAQVGPNVSLITTLVFDLADPGFYPVQIVPCIVGGPGKAVH